MFNINYSMYPFYALLNYWKSQDLRKINHGPLEVLKLIIKNTYLYTFSYQMIS